jgi:CopG family transcriptional regulator/antitoxin EndoAI
MAKRINVILPEATIKTIDRLSRPGERSRFIDRAIQHFVATASQDALQERLKQAALRDHDLDQVSSRDWFAVDQEQWQKLDETDKQRTEDGRSEAKSTSRRSIKR